MEAGVSLAVRHATGPLGPKPVEAALFRITRWRGEAWAVCVGVVSHRRGLDRCVAHTAEVGEANAEIAVSGTGERLVERPCLQEGREPDEEIGALDVRIAHQKEGRVEVVGRELGAVGLAGRDADDCRRYHVQAPSCDGLRTEREVVGFPFVVVVEDGSEKVSRVSGVAAEPFKAGVPGARCPAGAGVGDVNDPRAAEAEVVDDVAVVWSEGWIGIINDDEKVWSPGLALD